MLDTQQVGNNKITVTMVIQFVTIGNNHASFEDLHNSIAEMLSFQMFGIPLVGSDICGYLGKLYCVCRKCTSHFIMNMYCIFYEIFHDFK